MRATFQDSVAFLQALGFIYIGDSDVVIDDPVFLSPGEDSIGDFNVTLYLSKAGHYCAWVDGGYGAPIVWDGERLPEFVEWLDEHHAGWRGR